MKHYEQFYKCLDEVLLLKLLQIVVISIQWVLWLKSRRWKFPSDRKKISGPAFSSAEFEMILILFWLKFDIPMAKEQVAFLSS